MQINIKKCLEFFDGPSSRGHATAIVGMVGEELNACAFKHYVENNGGTAEILLDETDKPITVTPGTKKGKRLDRWIAVTKKGRKIVYQCEIKNWSSSAIGGKLLDVDADATKIKATADYHWSRQLQTEFLSSKYPTWSTKVLEKMKPPKNYEAATIEPLLIYWMPISNSSSMTPFFDVPISKFNNPAIKTTFEKLNVFSVSLYFRQLLSGNKDQKVLDFDMPDTEERVRILKNIGFL